LVLTLDQAVTTAREIVAAAGPGFSYPRSTPSDMSCTYTRVGQPSCLIGQILTRHGYSAEVLTAFDDQGSPDIEFLIAQGALAVENDEARLFLSLVQLFQDNRDTWENALSEGLKAVGLGPNAATTEAPRYRQLYACPVMPGGNGSPKPTTIACT
jgi:hypothetical protein